MYLVRWKCIYVNAWHWLHARCMCVDRDRYFPVPEMYTPLHSAISRGQIRSMSNKENCIYVLVWLIILVLQTKGDDCPWNSFYLSLLTYNLKYLFTFCPSVRQSIWRVNSEHFRLFLLIIIGSIKSNKSFKICYSDERCGPYASCFNMSIRTRRMMAATDRQRQDVLSLLLSLGRNQQTSNR